MARVCAETLARWSHESAPIRLDMSDSTLLLLLVNEWMSRLVHPTHAYLSIVLAVIDEAKSRLAVCCDKAISVSGLA
jgi:hypothetical protein